MRQAAEELTAEGSKSFTLTMLRERVQTAGHAYSPLTVREAVRWHLRHEDGSPARARAGWFRLRTTALRMGPASAQEGRNAGIPGVVTAAEARAAGFGPTAAVRAALSHLLPATGAPGVCTRRTEVEAWLERVGVPYSGRAVRLGIAELVADPTSEFARSGQWKIVRDQKPK